MCEGHSLLSWVWSVGLADVDARYMSSRMEVDMTVRSSGMQFCSLLGSRWSGEQQPEWRKPIEHSSSFWHIEVHEPFGWKEI